MSQISGFISMKSPPWEARIEELGKWNTASVTNGDYFLRLVITDNVGASLDPCVIAVRVLNQ